MVTKRKLLNKVLRWYMKVFVRDGIIPYIGRYGGLKWNNWV